MTTALIDREVFFGNPEIVAAKLSPDGSRIGFIKPYKNVRNIWVKEVDAPFEAAVPITNDERPISAYFWSRDGKFILYAQDKNGDENYNIYRVNMETLKQGEIPVSVNLTPYEEITASIYKRSKLDSDVLFIGLNNRDKSWHDLYQLSISTGKHKLIYQNEDFIDNFLFDLKDQLRIVSRPNANGGRDILTYQKDKLDLIFSSGIEDTISPLRFHPDGNQLYFITNQGDRDKTELILFDLTSREEKQIHADPLNEADIGNVDFADETEKLLYTIYETDRPRYYFFDKKTKKDFQYIQNQLIGKVVSVTSSTIKEDVWLIQAYDDKDPGGTYLFDRKQKSLEFLYHPRPNLPIDILAPVQSIRYNSIDGLEIQAFLTEPTYETTSKAAVVLVHGGPWARDTYGYHPYAQFLANRGYTVLQPNFRSSTGFGKQFLNAGNLEWGKKMQDDITAATGYLVNHNLATSDKIGVMGGSYGGYATLAALAFTPEVFAAGVDIVGPSSLLTLLDAIPPYWEAARKMLYMRVGDPETKKGKRMLIERSPLFHADKIKAPLMVIQGANDPRVKQVEADQIVTALRDRGYPVEYLMAADEGHGFRDPINNMAMIAAIERFFATYLGGRYQEEVPSHIQERLDDITVDIHSVSS